MKQFSRLATLPVPPEDWLLENGLAHHSTRYGRVRYDREAYSKDTRTRYAYETTVGHPFESKRSPQFDYRTKRDGDPIELTRHA